MMNASNSASPSNNPQRIKGPKKKKPANISRSYPRGVGVDFRKLSTATLISYTEHHGVYCRPEAPPSELAVAVARHFEASEVGT